MTCCDAKHEPTERFFTTARKDSASPVYRPLSGPFETHDAALADVDRVKHSVHKFDPRAPWYAYGTCGTSDPAVIEKCVAGIAALPEMFRVNAEVATA